MTSSVNTLDLADGLSEIAAFLQSGVLRIFVQASLWKPSVKALVRRGRYRSGHGFIGRIIQRYNGARVGRVPWRACSVRCSNSRNALTWDLRKGVAPPIQMCSAWELCSSGLAAVLTSSVLSELATAICLMNRLIDRLLQSS